MKTLEVLTDLRHLGVEGVINSPHPEDVLLQWAADGLLPPPHGKAPDRIWPENTIEMAAAVDSLIFRFGFQKGVVLQVLASIGEDAFSFKPLTSRSSAEKFYSTSDTPAVPVNKDILGFIAHMSPDIYLPAILFLIAFAKASLSCPLDRPASIEVWTEGGSLHFRPTQIDPKVDDGIHPTFPDRIVRKGHPASVLSQEPTAS